VPEGPVNQIVAHRANESSRQRDRRRLGKDLRGGNVILAATIEMIAWSNDGRSDKKKKLLPWWKEELIRGRYNGGMIWGTWCLMMKGGKAKSAERKKNGGVTSPGGSYRSSERDSAVEE